MFDAFDTQMMTRAMELAFRPLIPPYPNPRVGAVIARAGEVLAEGWHESHCAPHAEYAALEKLNFSAPGATIYVTLEPCCPFTGKRNPSCAELIIQAGIARAVIAYSHPLPGQNRGCDIMSSSGLTVERGLLAEDASLIVNGLFHYLRTGRPYVLAKWAMTADGLIAPPNRNRGDISDSEGFILLHKLRHFYDAVLVGMGTILKDNPRLNCREYGFSHPVRIVLDPRLKTPLNSNVADTTGGSRTVIFTTSLSDADKRKQFEDRGVEIDVLESSEAGRIPVANILARLAERKIYSLLVEGGSEVHGRFLEEKCVDEYLILVAPKILGGRQSLHPVGGTGLGDISDAVSLDDVQIQTLGRDIVITGKPRFDGRGEPREADYNNGDI